MPKPGMLISVPCVRKDLRTRGPLDIWDAQLSWQWDPVLKTPFLKISHRWRDVSEVNEGECWGRGKGFCGFGGPYRGSGEVQPGVFCECDFRRAGAFTA